MSEYANDEKRPRIGTEADLERALERVQAGLHPFRENKTDENGEVLEEVVKYELWEDSPNPNYPYAQLRYLIKVRSPGSEASTWRHYDRIAVFEKPVNPQKLKSKLINSRFPYGIVDKVLRAVDMSKEPMGFYQAYVDNPTTIFTMAGACGAGKTFGAIWAVAELLRRKKVKSCGFVKSADLDGYMRISNDDHLPEVPDRNVDILVIDDLCAEIVTSVIQDQAGRLISHRIERGLFTIITTNLVYEEIVSLYGERVGSRLIRDGADFVQLENPSNEAAEKEFQINL